MVHIKRFPQSLQIYSDGQSRAGVYCAANACIEQVIQHGEVDVFQAVKTVRRHRPQVVENIVSIRILISYPLFIFKFLALHHWHILRLINYSIFQTEYKYCYDLVLHYVLHYLHKEDEEQP